PVVRAAVPGRRDAGPTLAARAPTERRVIIFLLSREEARTKGRACPIAVAYLAYLVRKSAKKHRSPKNGQKAYINGQGRPVLNNKASDSENGLPTPNNGRI